MGFLDGEIGAPSQMGQGLQSRAVTAASPSSAAPHREGPGGKAAAPPAQLRRCLFACLEAGKDSFQLNVPGAPIETN